jgi:hypothetical protein
VDRETLRYTVVALLGGVAVALAAALLPGSSGSKGVTGGEGGATGIGSLLREPPDESPFTLPDFPWYIDALAEVFALVLAATAVYWVVYNWREAVKSTVRWAIVAGFVGILIMFVFVAIPNGFEPGEFGFGSDSTLGVSEGVDGGELVTTSPPLVVVVLLVTALVLAGVAYLFAQGEETETEKAEPATDESPRPEAVGQAAGRAADRLEDADPTENEIYRAWAEMGRLVSPTASKTKTTAEFTQAAVDAGLDPRDVRELTTLFEQVRYGGYAPSADDEQRAVTIFRTIEETYTEESS